MLINMRNSSVVLYTKMKLNALQSSEFPKNKSGLRSGMTKFKDAIEVTWSSNGLLD